MFVPLHDRHQIKQYDHAAEDQPQYDVAFATRTLGIIIPHVIAKGSVSAGSPANFSMIRVANSAAK